MVVRLCAEYLHRLPYEVEAPLAELLELAAYDELKAEAIERMRWQR